MAESDFEGDKISKLDHAQLWADAEMPHDHDEELKTEFRQVLKRIPQETRDRLQAMYNLEYEPRTDGGLGYGCADHLWHAFTDLKNGRDPQNIGEHIMGLSLNYVHALHNALTDAQEKQSKEN